MQINGIDYGPASIGLADESSKNQTRTKMGNGVIRVRDIDVEDRVLEISLHRITDTLKEGLRTYITVTLNYAFSTMTIIDDDSVTWTVRYWARSLKFTRRAGPFWAATLRVRVET